MKGSILGLLLFPLLAGNCGGQSPGCGAALGTNPTEASFRGCLELGDNLTQQNRDEDAIGAYRLAWKKSATNKQAALSTLRIAETEEKLGHHEEALSFVDESLRHFESEEGKQVAKQIRLARLDHVVSAPEIAATLKGKKTSGVEPTTDLPVNFDLNKDTLTAVGREQADELGKALSDVAFTGQRFRIIGHTDRTGSDEYNMKLSVRRAQTVASYLVENYHLQRGALEVVGKGKSEMLYHGETEEDDRLNRRVQISLLP